MKRATTWLVRGLLVLGVSVVGLAVAAQCGLRWNRTGSIAKGAYWVTSDAITKGRYVAFCPPARNEFDFMRERYLSGVGSCPGHFPQIFKKVLAAKGDHVAITPNGVSVNGQLLPFSKPYEADPWTALAMPVPVLDGVLSADDFLLMTDVSPNSIDARYFGLVHRSEILTVIRPIWTY